MSLRAPPRSVSQIASVLVLASACIHGTGRLPEGPPPEYEESPPPKGMRPPLAPAEPLRPEPAKDAGAPSPPTPPPAS